jgi:ribosome-binding factor A
MPNRVDQLNSLIMQYLAQIIEQEVDISRDILITVTKVETSKDIKYARVFISIIPESQRGTILKKLEAAKIGIQRALAQKMMTKFTPKLRFIIDENEVYASEIDKLLDSIKSE